MFLKLFQMNFFADHTKLIVCPLMQAVTYIDENRNFHTYRMSLIEKNGCSKELASRLKYARTMVERLTSSKSRDTVTKSAARPASARSTTSSQATGMTGSAYKTTGYSSKPSSGYDGKSASTYGSLKSYATGHR